MVASSGANYYLRPPHPAVLLKAYHADRCVSLRDLPIEEVEEVLREFESHDLMVEGYFPGNDFCPRHGNELGGYRYVEEVFGEAPVITGINVKEEVIKRAELEVLREIGLKMYVASHTGGTDPENPFEVSYGLLERPSDFGFPFASKLGDVGYDGGRIAAMFFGLAPQGYGRPLFGGILVHDYDFYKKSWLKTPILGEDNHYSREERERRFLAYEELVRAIASRSDVRVVTGRDIYSMYEKYSEGG